MVRSMTGFGQAEHLTAGYRIRVELKAVNHRFLETAVRLPREWQSLEDVVRRTIQQQVKRGRVDAFVTIESDGASRRIAAVDWKLAEAYAEAAEQLKERFGLEDSLTLGQLLQIPDLIAIRDATQSDPTLIEEAFTFCVQQAAEGLTSMRDKEGAHLEVDLRGRLMTLGRLRREISHYAPQVVEEYRARLSERVQEWLGRIPAEENRIAQEVALFVDRANIDEELIRLGSHLQQFDQLLQAQGPAGRKLDFLIQEMNREVNTIGSKAGALSIINIVVEMKAELEKIREQVQNVE